MEQWMWVIWLAIFIIAIIIEALGTDLVSIWFAFGALITLVISLFNVPWWVQVIIFIVVSAVFLFALRPLAHKIMRKNIITTNVEDLIGTKGIMTEKYDVLHHGKVNINGVIWTAIAKNEKDVLNVDDVVVVIGITGNKLVVNKYKKEGEK